MKTSCKPLLVLLLCALLLTACAQEAPPEPKRTVVGFSQLGAESDWRVANTASMMEALSEEQGFELLYDNARQKQENQLLAVRNFIVQDVDIIVIAPAEETGWDAVLQEAKDAGIPVIIVDREVAVEDKELYLTAIGSDFLTEGKRAVQWMEQRFPDQPLHILHLQGSFGATSQLMRSKAIEDAVEANEDWQFAAQLAGDYTESKAYEEVRAFLEAGGEFDVLYSENDNMTFGALRALDEAGITYGRDGEVAVISFDSVRRALTACMEGKIDLCVECNPLHGPRVAELIHQYLAGQSIPKQIFVEEQVFTPDSLTEDFIAAREY